jgi:SAM-dependent methyltransferase
MKANNPAPDWNQQFEHQAKWTRPLREYLSMQLGIGQNSRVLEVGCGTGAILRETRQISLTEPVGIDKDFRRLCAAKKVMASQLLATSDASALPFAGAAFDFVLSHYFWLWIKRPQEVLNSIWRVLKPGGKLVCFAEPDYGARVEYPPVFFFLGKLQTWSLQRQGAISKIGRRLPEMLASGGFTHIQFGLSGFQKQLDSVAETEFASEWEMLQYDLQKIVPRWVFKSLKESDLRLRNSGRRVSWIPTFYAIAEKPMQ